MFSYQNRFLQESIVYDGGKILPYTPVAMNARRPEGFPEAGVGR
jgi:hypothetical protein